MRRGLICVALLLAAVLVTVRGNAHVGAPDVYVKAAAGPYQLLVSVHPPVVVPGSASIDVRTQDAGVSAVSIALAGGEWQPLQAFAKEQLFTGGVWISSSGAWQVRIRVSGDRGAGETSVPVPATTGAGARRFLFSPLFWLLVLALVAGGWFAIRLPNKRYAVGATVLVAGYFVVLLVWSSGRDASAPTMAVSLEPGGRLEILLPRREGDLGDLINDHGHLMHLFAVREPEMDVLLHLHPAQISAGRFEARLPSMAGGAFKLYADVVHRDGTLETFTAQAGFPAQTGHALAGDDSVGVVPGISRTTPISGPGMTSVRLMDGYRMTLELGSALHARTGQLLRFTLLDAEGSPPADMQLYMGMSAHAAVFKSDGTVFAHIHPAGTLPMAAYGGSVMDMSGAPSREVSFPFGFPSAGAYRVFLEMKHGNIIETGAFDLKVLP